MKQNKIIIIIIFSILLISIVYAIPICNTNSISDDDIPCLIVTPIIYCNDYFVDIYYNNTFLETKTLNNYSNNSYYFEFNNSFNKGDYYLILCDGTTRQLKYGDFMFNISDNTLNILLIIIFLILTIVLGIFWSEIFLVIAGIILIIGGFVLYSSIITLIFYLMIFLGILFIFIGVLLFFKK